MVHIGDLSENMKLRTRDGVELGTIIRIDADGVLVEKGLSFLEDFLVPIELVSEVRDGDVFLSVTRADLPLTREGLEIAARTLGAESSVFVHEGEELGATDNLKEGESRVDEGGSAASMR
jgi:hypothetical protein